jgi:hypothetical protein
MLIKRYFLIKKKIEERKEELRKIYKNIYWGEEYDLGAEFAEDGYLQEKYKELEDCLLPRKYEKKWYKYKGIPMTLVELAKESVVTYDILRHRVLYQGWTLEKAMKTPKIYNNGLSTTETTFLQSFYESITLNIDKI